MTKTELYLKLVMNLYQQKIPKISEDWLKEFLGNPPKATWHRYVSELTQGFGEIPAILVRFKNEDEDFFST
jgi:hypothetical protein